VQTIFIMVKCELGQAYDVADRTVQDIEEVSEIHSTSGQYDLLMKCYLNDGADIGHFVKDTFTLIGYKAFT
jgi:DNA-binding Lrp family transcriptional regulator